MSRMPSLQELGRILSIEVERPITTTTQRCFILFKIRICCSILLMPLLFALNTLELPPEPIPLPLPNMPPFSGSC
jgi:hypothetical protein